MKPISQLETERQNLLAQAEALSTKAGATAEELAQADGLLDQAEQLGTEIKGRKSQEGRLARIQAGRQSATHTTPATLAVTPTEPTGNPVAALTGNPTVPATPKSYGQLKAFTAERCGADADRQAYAFGAWCLGLTNHSAASHYRERAQQLGMSYESLAHAAGVNTAGGYVVEEKTTALINYLRRQYGVMRRNAENIAMGNSEVANSPMITAGLRVYAAQENTARTASQLTFGNVELVSRDWAVLSLFSNKLNDMAVINLGDTIASDMGYQFALNEDTCCFNGDGTSTYQGIQGLAYKIAQSSYSASVFTAASGHTSFGALTTADFSGVLAKLPNYVGIQPKWYISKAGWALSMQPLALAGGYISPELAATMQFYGYPVEFVEVLPQTDQAQVSTIVALFGDLRLAAKFGERLAVRMASSSDRYFELDQTAVKAESSFAFNAYRLGDTSTAGPVIALKTPAS